MVAELIFLYALDYLRHGNAAVAYRSVQVVHGVQPLARRGGLEQLRSYRDIVSLELALEFLPAAFDVLLAALLLEPASYFALCLGGLCDLYPVAVRTVVRRTGSEYLHDLAGMHNIIEADHSAADLRAGHFIADLRVDMVCEIQHRSPGGERNNVALRSEHEHLVRREVGLYCVSDGFYVICLLLALK